MFQLQLWMLASNLTDCERESQVSASSAIFILYKYIDNNGIKPLHYGQAALIEMDKCYSIAVLIIIQT